MERLRLATVWLGGCSGCHMSFLDLDEWLIDLAGRTRMVFSPFMDIKDYPEGVDLALIEGAVANEENREMILRVRPRTRVWSPGASDRMEVLLCSLQESTVAKCNLPVGRAQWQDSPPQRVFIS